MQTKQADREIYTKFTFNYNRFHKETLLKFRYNVFTCPGNGKISAIVAAIKKRPYIFKSIAIIDNDIAHGDINSRTHDFTKKQ